MNNVRSNLVLWHSNQKVPGIFAPWLTAGSQGKFQLHICLQKLSFPFNFPTHKGLILKTLTKLVGTPFRLYSSERKPFFKCSYSSSLLAKKNLPSLFCIEERNRQSQFHTRRMKELPANEKEE